MPTTNATFSLCVVTMTLISCAPHLKILSKSSETLYFSFQTSSKTTKIFFLPNLSLILESVWIGLILLKLKTYCWNHCSKIIFKCINSTVGPIFNEKVVKKWNLWVHEQYIMHCLRQKSQHLRLLFIEQYMNSNRVLPKRVEKKKRKT